METTCSLKVVQDKLFKMQAFLVLKSDSRILVAFRNQNLLFDFDHNKLEFLCMEHSSDLSDSR